MGWEMKPSVPWEEACALWEEACDPVGGSLRPCGRLV